MKILITGGHLTPALALIEELQQQLKNRVEIVFVGRKHPSETEKVLSLEYEEVTKKGIKFIPLVAGRLTRVLTLRTVRNFLRFPSGLWQAFKIVKNERPNLVFSFGGYLALSIALSAFILGIPVYTHEQTVYPGLANRIIGLIAKKIFVAFEGAAGYFNRQKVVITGNPVREEIFKIIKKPFNIEKDRPVIYVTGGSLGAHSINQLVFEILPKLLKKYIVIHQLGESQKYQDFRKAEKIENKYYFPRKHFLTDEIGYVYSICDLVIGRAGANTFFELLSLEKPALFIPLPWAAGGEQEKQAKFFNQNKVGEIFYQFGLSNQLLAQIDKMISNLGDYQKNFSKLANLTKKNAAELMVEKIVI